MISKPLRLISFVIAGWISSSAYSQSFSSSSNLKVQPVTDRMVPFKLSEPGIVRQVEWGGDMAWMHEQNLRRCVAFMGKDNVSVVRASFQPTHPLVNGELQQEQTDAIKERLRLLSFCKPDVKLVIRQCGTLGAAHRRNHASFPGCRLRGCFRITVQRTGLRMGTGNADRLL